MLVLFCSNLCRHCGLQLRRRRRLSLRAQVCNAASVQPSHQTLRAVGWLPRLPLPRPFLHARPSRDAADAFSQLGLCDSGLTCADTKCQLTGTPSPTPQPDPCSDKQGTEGCKCVANTVGKLGCYDSTLQCSNGLCRPRSTASTASLGLAVLTVALLVVAL